MSDTTPGLAARINEFSAAVGRDPLLVQGAGGNISWKQGNTLHVKASGTWLADAVEREIFVSVNLQKLRFSLGNSDFEAIPEVLDGVELRPSIETLLHALMPHRFVIHVHAIEALAHLVRADAEATLDERIGSQLRWALVDYQKPGAALARAVSETLHEYPDVEVIFLRNHGIVVGADNLNQIEALLGILTNLLSNEPIQSSKAPLKIPDAIVSTDYVAVNDADIHKLACLPEFFVRLETEWALYPDHVVFLGDKPHVFNSITEFRAAFAAGRLPDIAFIGGYGVFARGELSKAKLAQLRCYYDVLIRQSSPRSSQPLSSRQIAELLNWDAEKYRISLEK